MNRRSSILLLAMLLVPCGVFEAAPDRAEARAPEAGPIRFLVTASKPRLNRRVTGPVSREVDGVPAEPVDSMVYDGVGSVPIEGDFEMEIDPLRGVGFVRAAWTDENGSWSYRQTRFVHPEHASGVRLGSSVNDTEFVFNDPVAQNVYLHGDTSAGMPVLPTLFCYLAAWGRAEVQRNGRSFENPFEIPAPLWLGHLMVSEGARHPDGTVRNRQGGIFDPRRASEGIVEDADLEVHLTFHDERFPTTRNFPPIFSFFYHLVFEEVSLRLIQSEGDGGSDPPPLSIRSSDDVAADPEARRRVR